MKDNVMGISILRIPFSFWLDGLSGDKLSFDLIRSASWRDHAVECFLPEAARDQAAAYELASPNLDGSDF